MTDRDKLREIMGKAIEKDWKPEMALAPLLADAILAAGFGDVADYKDEIRTKKIIVEQHFRREVRLVEWVDELRKRVAELEEEIKNYSKSCTSNKEQMKQGKDGGMGWSGDRNYRVVDDGKDGV